MMRPEVYQACDELKQAIVYPCKVCGGAGYLEQENPIELNPCECMLSLHYLSALIEARIPKDYWALSLDDLTLVDPAYVKFVRWYLARVSRAAEQGKGILFLGANGTGKTSMQCAIGKESVVQGYSVRYFTAQQYIEASRSGNDSMADDFESAKFLLLDEIDKVYMKSGSNYVQKTLEEFLRRRISGGAVVIACTNYEASEFESVFGSSTTSMLQRHLKFIPIEGEDYSDRLQDRWEADMDRNVDYFDSRIMSMARRLWDREQEEYARVWKDPND